MNTADPQEMFVVLFTGTDTRTATTKVPDHPFFEISSFQAEKPLSAEKIPTVPSFANFMLFFPSRKLHWTALPTTPIIKAAFPLKNPTLQINILYAQNIFEVITTPIIVSTRYYFMKSKYIH